MDYLLESRGVSLDKSGRVRVGVKSRNGFGSERWCWHLDGIVVTTTHAIARIACWRLHRRRVVMVVVSVTDLIIHICAEALLLEVLADLYLCDRFL